MAIQTINLTVPGGDTPRSANTKINANFSDQTNAASRLLGTGAEQVPLSKNIPSLLGTAATKDSSYFARTVGNTGFLNSSWSTRTRWGLNKTNFPDGMGHITFVDDGAIYYSHGIAVSTSTGSAFTLTNYGGNASRLVYTGLQGMVKEGVEPDNKTLVSGDILINGINVKADSNGFFKAASPIVDLYDNKIDLNHDATEQGGITFEKLGVGDYLVKGSLGFSQDGWYIETPKDANGNVLVAVVYEQLENNDLTIKTYAKKFDEETGDIVANLAKPRDIPNGRFISLRLHEIPKEPPVVPTQDTSADTPGQTNNP